MKLSGVNLPTDTLCGSVPDAYWVLNDGTAYGTYMGGPDIPGPCLYTNGETRIGNGFAGHAGLGRAHRHRGPDPRRGAGRHQHPGRPRPGALPRRARPRCRAAPTPTASRCVRT